MNIYLKHAHKSNFNDFMDSRNLENEFNQGQAPNKLKFNTGRYHVLREIYRKFGRASSVKRISLYLKSRARPVRKHTSKYTALKSQVGPPNSSICPTENTNQFTIKINPNISKILII